MCIVVLIAGSWFSACVLFITAGSPSVLLSQSTLTVDLRLKSIYNDIYIYIYRDFTEIFLWLFILAIESSRNGYVDHFLAVP